MDEVNNIYKQIGRRAGGVDTRAQILDAARYLFAEKGLNQTTMRQIALKADVDPALIVHYFKTKKQLFVESVTPTVHGAQVEMMSTLSGVDRGHLGQKLAESFVAFISDDHKRLLLLGIIRSVTSDEHAVVMFKSFIEHTLTSEIEKYVSKPNQKFKAELLGSQLIGLVLARYVIKIEPLASCSPEMLVEYLAPRLQVHFNE